MFSTQEDGIQMSLVLPELQVGTKGQNGQEWKGPPFWELFLPHPGSDQAELGLSTRTFKPSLPKQTKAFCSHSKSQWWPSAQWPALC